MWALLDAAKMAATGGHGARRTQGNKMSTFHRVTPAGLAYLAAQLAEATGKEHAANSPAVAAYAADCEASADRGESPQCEVRAVHSATRRPVLIYLDGSHVEAFDA